MSTSSPRTPGFLLLGAGVATLALVRLRGAWAPWVDVHRWLADLGVPREIRNLDASLLLLGVPFVAALALARGRPRQALAGLGLTAPVGRALHAAVLFTIPMFVAGALVGSTPRPSAMPLVLGVAIAPLVEEVFFRGMLCALLVRAGRLRFWPAAAVSGVLFGLSHVSWTAPPTAASALVFLITGAGGVWFAWMLRGWRWNLWVPICLHALMNLSWMLFGLADGPVGGLWANLGRAATVALAIVGTLRPAWFGLPRLEMAEGVPWRRTARGGPHDADAHR